MLVSGGKILAIDHAVTDGKTIFGDGAGSPLYIDRATLYKPGDNVQIFTKHDTGEYYISANSGRTYTAGEGIDAEKITSDIVAVENGYVEKIVSAFKYGDSDKYYVMTNDGWTLLQLSNAYSADPADNVVIYQKPNSDAYWISAGAEVDTSNFITSASSDLADKTLALKNNAWVDISDINRLTTEQLSAISSVSSNYAEFTAFSASAADTISAYSANSGLYVKYTDDSKSYIRLFTAQHKDMLLNVLGITARDNTTYTKSEYTYSGANLYHENAQLQLIAGDVKVTAWNNTEYSLTSHCNDADMHVSGDDRARWNEVSAISAVSGYGYSAWSAVSAFDITSDTSDSLSAYYDVTDNKWHVSAAPTQNVLTPGDGISIESNVISVSGYGIMDYYNGMTTSGVETYLVIEDIS